MVELESYYSFERPMRKVCFPSSQRSGMRETEEENTKLLPHAELTSDLPLLSISKRKASLQQQLVMREYCCVFTLQFLWLFDQFFYATRKSNLISQE